MKFHLFLVALCLLGTTTAWASRGPAYPRGMAPVPDLYSVQPLGAYPPSSAYRFRETAGSGSLNTHESQTQSSAQELSEREKEEQQERDSLEFGSAAMSAAQAQANAEADTSMMVRNKRCPHGNTFLKCPFAEGTCCGDAGFAQACCPTGYMCSQRVGSWHCVAGSGSTQHQPASRPVTSISPTIVVTNGAPSTAASTTVTPNSAASTSGMDDDADDDGGSARSTARKRAPVAAASSTDDGSDAFKPKQNIIIVKNINVLTKGVAPASSLANKSDK